MIPLIIGNWKMHKTPSEARTFARAFLRGLPKRLSAEASLAPAFPALAAVSEILKKSRRAGISLAAQDVHEVEKGAFTGEVSAAMLADLGVKYVLVGHSERRRIFHETDALVDAKARAALAAGIVPVVCVGESWEERRAGKTNAVLKRQLDGAFTGSPRLHPRNIVVAYEPVWAIGTGRTASPQDAAAAHRFIAAHLRKRHGGKPRRILYGGSVTPENARALLAAPLVGGLLVGGASLDAKVFLKILAVAEK